MRITVIQCNTQFYSAYYYTGLCLAANSLYCKKYNYGLVAYNLPTRYSLQYDNICCKSITTGKFRGAGWGKIPCLYNTLESVECDYVVYIDNDAFFNPKYNLEELIQENLVQRNKDILFSSCKQKGFSYINQSTVTKKLKETTNIPCSSMLILKNTKQSRSFLKHWYLQEPNIRVEPMRQPWDKAGLWDAYNSTDLDIQILEEENFITKKNLNDISLFDKKVIHCTSEYRYVLTQDFVSSFFNNFTFNTLKNELTQINNKCLNTDVEDVKTHLHF